MAKNSMVEREKKRTKTVAKYAVKRAALKEIIGDRNASEEERWEAQIKLQTAKAITEEGRPSHEEAVKLLGQ